MYGDPTYVGGVVNSSSFLPYTDPRRESRENNPKRLDVARYDDKREGRHFLFDGCEMLYPKYCTLEPHRCYSAQNPIGTLFY